jgi:hypothetical protein
VGPVNASVRDMCLLGTNESVAKYDPSLRRNSGKAPPGATRGGPYSWRPYKIIPGVVGNQPLSSRMSATTLGSTRSICVSTNTMILLGDLLLSYP